MAYPDITTVNNSAGMAGLFTYSAEVVPIFPALLLFAFFIIALLGSYFAQLKRGRGDFPGSFAVSSWLTFIVAVTMSLIDNFIQIQVLGITLGIAILGTFWLYFSRPEGV